jgi:hypothetical protein
MESALLERPAETPRPRVSTRRIALLGFARSFSDAPFEDPTVCIVGMNELYRQLPRWDVWFELHDTNYLGLTARIEDPNEPQRHLDWLKRQPADKPIYMIRRFEDIPASVAYPLEAMCTRFGKYFTSTVGYMLAWAIDAIVQQRRFPNVAEAGEWIGLFGIDLASDTEYVHQRPNAEYLVGVARGMGITVDVPPASAIMHAPALYGFEPPPMETGLVNEFFLRKQMASIDDRMRQQHARLNTLDGVIQAYGFMVDQRANDALQLTPEQVAFLREQLEAKRTDHGETLALWNTLNGCLQAYTHCLQVMDFRRRGVYVPDADPFAEVHATGSTS